MLQMQEQGAVSNQHILGRATVQWQRGRKNRPKTRDPARTGHGEADSRHPIQQGPKRVAVKTTNARSPRPEPTQSLVGRVVVNAEVLRDPADAGTSVVHRAADGGNDLVDRDNERVENANVGNKTTEGSESFKSASTAISAATASEPRPRRMRATRFLNSLRATVSSAFLRRRMSATSPCNLATSSATHRRACRMAAGSRSRSERPRRKMRSSLKEGRTAPKSGDKPRQR